MADLDTKTPAQIGKLIRQHLSAMSVIGREMKRSADRTLETIAASKKLMADVDRLLNRW